MTHALAWNIQCRHTHYLMVDALYQRASKSSHSPSPCSIKSLTGVLTQLMRVSDHEVLVASVRRSSSCGKSDAVWKLHPQGQRWQTTSQDQTEPTVKHNHRCFALINTPFTLHNTSLKKCYRRWSGLFNCYICFCLRDRANIALK